MRIRIPVLLTALSILLSGQEAGAPGWDFRHVDGGLGFDWEVMATMLLVGVAMGGFWKLLIWFLETRRNSINWKAMRLWWPTLMLACGWMMILLERRGLLPEPLEVIYAFLNLAGALAVAVTVGLLGDYLPPWANGLMGSLAFWAGDYLLLRLAEWRAWKNEPVSLHLLDKPE